MKTYPNIDYAFAPASYWADADPLAAILRNVTGENRRRMIRDSWRAEKLDQLDEALLADQLPDDRREALGRIHPSFLGGEFLPGYLPGEVEIARICLQSTTSDVISLRARRTRTGIAYRVVDEYEEVFLLPIAVSDEPLTLAELIRQFDEGSMEDPGFPDGGLSLGYNNLNAESGDFERLRHFTRIESDFYPQLCAHFERVFAEWVAEGVAQRDGETGAEGGHAA